jgi:ABC-type transport system involved in cytochrome bd biosynthesis fused ATPase/permease subunit
MMDPLSHLLGNIPNSFSAFGCFKRIQEFLMLEERIDRRRIHDNQSGPSSKSSQENTETQHEAFELKTLGKVVVDGSRISISDGNFNWGEKTVLNSINTAFPRHENGSLVMVIGPVGSGKSSFLKAILGETTSSKGRVSLSSLEVAFCEQSPWVMNATIRANIIAESKGFDSAWFDTVVNACDLSIDLGRFPDGDLTMVGDKGVKLSGGQKQRLVSQDPFDHGLLLTYHRQSLERFTHESLWPCLTTSLVD